MANPSVRACTQLCLIPVQDDFLDSLHNQTMEAHQFVLAEIGVDAAEIPAPDMCLVGVYMSPTGDYIDE